MRMLRSRASASSATFSASAIFSRRSLVSLISAVASCLFFLELSDFFGRFVALGFQRLGFGDGGAPLEIDRIKILEDGLRIHATLAEFFFDQVLMIANKGKIEHKRSE